MGLSLGDKAQRTLRLLLGLRNPRVIVALAAYGFTENDMDEGWELLRALGRSKLGFPAIPHTDVEVIQLLDAWENRWFPVAVASLTRRFPAAHAQMFMNLSQTEGPEVAVSVGTFVESSTRSLTSMALTDPTGPRSKNCCKHVGSRQPSSTKPVGSWAPSPR